MFSYLFGMLIAGLIVFGLYFGMQVASPAYARQISAQRAAGKSLDEQKKMLTEGILTERIAALTAIGMGDDRLEERVKLIAKATASSDESIQSICKLSIRRMGDRVKPTVRKMLDSKDPELVHGACGVIRSLGTSGDEYAQDIFALLKDGDRIDRHAAIYALQEMSPEVLEQGVDLVAGMLDEKEFNTQCVACFVLRRMGRGAEPATARLVQLLDEGNVSTRSRAAQALAAIGPVEGFDIPALVAETINAENYMERSRGLDALGELGPNASKYLPEIEKVMQNKRLHCACEAALCYYRVSGEASAPMKILMNEVSQKRNRVVAIECIGGMKDDAIEAVPTLVEFLDDGDYTIIETSILALKNIGPAAQDALPKLKKMLKHEDFLISVAAQEAIDAISIK
jgi:HEAT repeat protein